MLTSFYATIKLEKYFNNCNNLGIETSKYDETKEINIIWITKL